MMSKGFRLLCSFNSLQTGRAFPTFVPTFGGIVTTIAIVQVFQFPSNGKGFLNWYQRSAEERARPHVSIPFKREGLSQLIRPNLTVLNAMSRFNSLQTGKALQTLRMPFVILATSISFNSLQTGKAFQTRGRHIRYGSVLSVSIPFKRERLSKQVRRSFERQGLSGFNSLQTGWSFRTCPHGQKRSVTFYSFDSLQTGTAFRTLRHNQRTDWILDVSIPFKREGLSELFR